MTGIDLDLARIRGCAVGAAPGPWQAEPQCGRGAWIKSAKTGAWTALSCGDDDLDGAANAAHIASADPPTVIAMCDLITRQAEEIARLKAAAVHQRAERRRAAHREVVTWLHERAETMNDGHAQQLLNGAAFYVGTRSAKATRALTPKEDTPCRTA